MADNFECSICLEFHSTVAEDKFVAVNSCGHVFHRGCLNAVLAQQTQGSGCPNCRGPVTPITILTGVYPNQRHKTFKIVVIGDSAVGKTCLLRRYTENHFDPTTISTIGIDFRTTTIQVGEESVKLEVWDTSGQERFKATTWNYIRDAQGAILAYDVTHINSLVNVKAWFDLLNDYAPHAIKVLVGCKGDRPSCGLRQCAGTPNCRASTEAEQQEMSESLGIHSYITSAKEQINVQVVFRDLTVQILQNRYLVREARRRQASRRLLVDGGQEPQVERSGCFIGRLWDKLFG